MIETLVRYVQDVLIIYTRTILLLNFEKPCVLMLLCIISYKSQNLSVLFDTSHDDFCYMEAELQPFF